MQNRTDSAQAKYGEFLRHASLCDALAASVAEPVDRAALGEMANRWRALARYTRRQARVGANQERVAEAKPRSVSKESPASCPAGQVAESYGS
jgi:hypothetical protein